mmetsp:Transcript_414/g.472  ORF Transcript_414/g.472 Transcript_414/m.472 type:complete len:317 (-) Transcript_414:86-1036(-)
MDSFVTLGDDNTDTLQVGSLGSPITGRSTSVFVTSQDDGINTFLLVLLGSVEDIHDSFGRNVQSLGSNLSDEFVDKSDVGEGSTSHNFVISSSGTISIVILRFDTTAFQITSSRRILGDLTSGTNVISCDRVTQVQQSMSTFQILDGFGSFFGLLEERRIVNIGGALLPLVQFTSGSFQSVPSLGTLGDLAINFGKHFRSDDSTGDSGDFFSGRPDIAQEDRVTGGVVTQGLGFEIDVNSSSQGVGDNQRRRGQVVGPGERMNSTFEVSVSGQNSGRNQIGFGQSGGNFFIEITTVSNAGHATITGNGETELVQMG